MINATVFVTDRCIALKAGDGEMESRTNELTTLCSATHCTTWLLYAYNIEIFNVLSKADALDSQISLPTNN